MPRNSLLCFLDCDGLVDAFMTEGTFDRKTFVECCRSFALSGQVQQYPGQRSVWILDGARIHCHKNITYYLRSLGIIPVFLPAYCPFFNPIEYFFGIVKRRMRRQYSETQIKAKEQATFIATILQSFRSYTFRKVFVHCGYSPSGLFNPGSAYSKDINDLGFDMVAV